MTARNRRRNGPVPDSALHPRDRGPVRAYVRDVVDSRRSLVGLFVPAFGGVLITTLGPASELQATLQVVSLAALAVSLAAAVVLGVNVTRMARAEFPKAQVDGLPTGFYAFMRAHRPRSTRLPPPRVTR